jgi:hypothetical protein
MLGERAISLTHTRPASATNQSPEAWQVGRLDDLLFRLAG